MSFCYTSNTVGDYVVGGGGARSIPPPQYDIAINTVRLHVHHSSQYFLANGALQSFSASSHNDIHRALMCNSVIGMMLVGTNWSHNTSPNTFQHVTQLHSVVAAPAQ